MTADLQSAAQNLYNSSSLCDPSGAPVDAVSQFQQAYVNAGGAWTDLGLLSGPDGLYSPSTQGALQATLNAIGFTDTSGNALAAPAACAGNTVVGALFGTSPSAAPGAPASASGLSVQTILVVGALVALVGYLVWSSRHAHRPAEAT